MLGVVACFGAVKECLLGELARWRLLGFSFRRQCESCSHEHICIHSLDNYGNMETNGQMRCFAV